MSAGCLTSPTSWRTAGAGPSPSHSRASQRPPMHRSPFQTAEPSHGAAHHGSAAHHALSVQIPRADSVQNVALCARNNSCAATALSAALSVALSLEASPSKVVESIIDFGSDLLLDFVPLSQLLSGKAAAGAAAAGGAGAMHMLTQACDASCLGNALADGGHLLAQNAQNAAWLADSLAGLADDAVGGQVLKVIAAAGVAFAVRRALEPVAAPLSPRSAAAVARAQQKKEAAVAPLAATIALGMLACSPSSPAAATAAKALQHTQQAPEPLTSPKAVAVAATAAAESAIKDATSWPVKLQKRARKAAAEINEGKLSLMGVLVAVDVAAAVHNAGDVAQMVQQVAGGS